MSYQHATLFDVRTDATYRIDELAERAATALVASGTVPPSARVSALPDRRMLRYYTTIGLLDRPVEIRGRTAYYGRRHLLQIVAVKRLQAAGASLAEVQRRLAGASTTDLERLADLPPGEPDSPGDGNGAGNAAAVPPAPSRRFWQAAPPAATTSLPVAPAVPGPAGPVPVALRLAPGVTLVVDATRPLSATDQDAVRAAAAGLLADLTARGLLAAEPQER